MKRINVQYRLFQWVSPRTNEGVWSATHNTLGDAGQAAADTRLLYLRNQPPPMWVDPHARRLAWRVNPDCKDIYEIRFKANNIQQRPMGYFGPGSDTFTVVLWATHKANHWSPRDFCRVAQARWQDIQNGSATCFEIEID